METNLATKTLADLQAAVDIAPEAVRELLRDYDCEVPATTDALVLLAQVKGEPFVDDLYILLNQVSKVDNKATRFAGINGVIEQSIPAPGNAPALTRTSLAEGLKVLLEMLTGKVGTSGTAGGVQYDANANPDGEPVKPKILGLSQPVFYAGCVVLVLAIVVLLMHKHKP